MSVATPDVIEEVDLSEFEEPELVCELSRGTVLRLGALVLEFIEPCGRPAEWVLVVNCELPGHPVHRYLACSDCHDEVVADPRALLIHGIGAWSRL